jgi:hypothetical protein
MILSVDYACFSVLIHGLYQAAEILILAILLSPTTEAVALLVKTEAYPQDKFYKKKSCSPLEGKQDLQPFGRSVLQVVKLYSSSNESAARFRRQ